MHPDDKVDNQSNDSAASSDSGVITDEKFMSDTSQCNIDITTSIDCADYDVNDTAINIENIINLAKNVSPTHIKGSPRTARLTDKSSPTFSIRSTNISITSIPSDAVSSVLDSDSDEFEESNGKYTIKRLGQQTSCLPGSRDIPNMGGSDGVILLQQSVDGECMSALATASTSMASGVPQVGNVAFTNSTDITIGQKNYYQGPVTIQQFLIESRKREGVTEAGNDNPAFDNDEAKRTPGDHDNSKESNSPPQPYKYIFNRKAAIITAVIIILTIGLGVVFVTTSSVLKRKSKPILDDENSRKNVPVNTNIGLDNTGAGRVLRMVLRDSWLAMPPSNPLDKLQLPVHRVVICHTATVACTSQATCASRALTIQKFHMDSVGFHDIGYNFLVGGDGSVYEGRGWDDQGAHTKGYNADSIGIAFIGTFSTIKPPEKQLNVAKLLIEEGVKRNKIVENYQLYGARQLVGTDSPGPALYEIIKTWPNWSSVVK